MKVIRHLARISKSKRTVMTLAIYCWLKTDIFSISCSWLEFYFGSKTISFHGLIARYNEKCQLNYVFSNHLLQIQIVNICIALRKKNGGFLEENECLTLLKAVRANKNTQEVTMEDLRKAVDSIQKLGTDFRILETGTKRVICSVAVELNADHMGVLKFAEENGG